MDGFAAEMTKEKTKTPERKGFAKDVLDVFARAPSWPIPTL
jgi:hypothetical protein